MEAELVHHLLSLSVQFRAVDPRAESTVGRLSAGDGDFFERLRSGAGFTVRKYDQVVRWFAANWPAGAEWPCDVARPINEVAA